jgi:hypothetical protein
VACTPAARPEPPSGADATSITALCYEPSTSGTATAGASNVDACAIWNSLSQMSGAVTLTRDPTSLTMAFATGVVFSGTVVDRNVMLTYTHLHDFEDGCKWRATETLAGDLDPATCVMTLDYHYMESVEVSNGACATPCSGAGSVSLQIAPIL